LLLSWPGFKVHKILHLVLPRLKEIVSVFGGIDAKDIAKAAKIILNITFKNIIGVF
jgi:hypothetical protein